MCLTGQEVREENILTVHIFEHQFMVLNSVQIKKTVMQYQVKLSRILMIQ